LERQKTTMKFLSIFNQPKRPNEPKQEPQEEERRSLNRKDFDYYMQLIDDGTQEFVGHLVDIGSGGFKLDCRKLIELNKDFRFRMELTKEVAQKPYIVFLARSMWCKIDPLDPFVYNVGFQLLSISPGDLEIFNRMIEKYGRKHQNRPIDFRRTNKW
jgi:hypothetical protein